jgi:dephospho-CoA kinase
MQRDKINCDELEKRLNKQSPVNKKFTQLDYIIFNNEKQLIIPQIVDIHQKITKSIR